jgi:hypothetical protein
MKTDCCGKEFTFTHDHPVKWNPYNEVIQCHMCGHIYVPAKEGEQLLHEWEKERKETPID